MGLLKDPKRLAAAQTFLMLPLWGDQPAGSNCLKGRCENCAREVAWQADSAAKMTELKAHLLCPDCIRQLMMMVAVESLGRLDKGELR